jgi:UDP-N-acetylmuramate dehydrogenase
MTVLESTPALGSAFSTYRVGGPIDCAYFPQTLEQAVEVLAVLGPKVAQGQSLSVLGWGSNTLVASQGIAGATLILRKLASIEPLGPNRFRIGAGTHLAKVATFSVDAGLTGGEFLIGIPGTMGGAVAMNAGAMGQDTAAIVERVAVFDLAANELCWLEKTDLTFGYRQSNLSPTRSIVLAVDCLFQPGDMATAKARMADNMAFRKAHHPHEPNGGSVFRNPDPAHPVGKLVDELGGRGQWQVGQALVSPMHGNFIINLGEATSADVLGLMAQVQRRVFEATGWRIFPENRWMGQATEAETNLWHQLKQGDPHGDDAHAA